MLKTVIAIIVFFSSVTRSDDLNQNIDYVNNITLSHDIDETSGETMKEDISVDNGKIGIQDSLQDDEVLHDLSENIEDSNVNVGQLDQDSNNIGPATDVLTDTEQEHGTLIDSSDYSQAIDETTETANDAEQSGDESVENMVNSGEKIAETPQYATEESAAEMNHETETSEKLDENSAEKQEDSSEYSAAEDEVPPDVSAEELEETAKHSAGEEEELAEYSAEVPEEQAEYPVEQPEEPAEYSGEEPEEPAEYSAEEPEEPGYNMPPRLPNSTARQPGLFDKISETGMRVFGCGKNQRSVQQPGMGEPEYGAAEPSMGGGSIGCITGVSQLVNTFRSNKRNNNNGAPEPEMSNFNQANYLGNNPNSFPNQGNGNNFASSEEESPGGAKEEEKEESVEERVFSNQPAVNVDSPPEEEIMQQANIAPVASGRIVPMMKPSSTTSVTTTTTTPLTSSSVKTTVTSTVTTTVISTVTSKLANATTSNTALNATSATKLVTKTRRTSTSDDVNERSLKSIKTDKLSTTRTTKNVTSGTNKTNATKSKLNQQMTTGKTTISKGIVTSTEKASNEKSNAVVKKSIRKRPKKQKAGGKQQLSGKQNSSLPSLKINKSKGKNRKSKGKKPKNSNKRKNKKVKSSRLKRKVSTLFNRIKRRVALPTIPPKLKRLENAARPEHVDDGALRRRRGGVAVVNPGDLDGLININRNQGNGVETTSLRPIRTTTHRRSGNKIGKNHSVRNPKNSRAGNKMLKSFVTKKET